MTTSQTNIVQTIPNNQKDSNEVIVKDTVCGKSCKSVLKTFQKIMLLIVISGCFIGTTIVTNVSRKITMNMFHTRYAFFASQFMNVFYVPQAVALLVLLRITKILPSVKGFKQRYYILLGGMDSLGVLFLALGNEFTPGELQTVFSQLTIPVSLILSVIILRKRYGLCGYFGAFVIIIGVCLIIAGSNFVSFKNIKWYSCIIFCAGFFVYGLSFVLKEYFLKNSENQTTAIHLTTWVGFWMVPISLLLTPIQCLPYFGGVKVTELLPNIYYGMKCFVGIPTYADDTCSNVWIPLVVFTIFTFINGVFAIILVKYGSTLIQYIATSLSIPVNTMCYCIPFFMGSFVEPFTVWSVVSALVVIFGMITYCFGDNDIISTTDNDKEILGSINGEKEPLVINSSNSENTADYSTIIEDV